MFAILKLYVNKGKKFPLLMAALTAVLLLWIMVLKILVDPGVINGSFNVKIVNLGIFIYGLYFLVKRDSLSKGGFVLRLPLSDKEIIAANIAAFWILSVSALILSSLTALAILYFFKMAGFKIVLSWDKFSLSQFFAFLEITMYLALFYSIVTLVQTKVSGQSAKKLVLLTLILLPFLLITFLAVIFKTTSIQINSQTISMLYHSFPMLKGFFSFLENTIEIAWKIRLIIGYALIFLFYKLRYLADA